MKIENIPFTAIDWSALTRTQHPGSTGLSHWQTVEVGKVRLRVVEYSPGYVADSWCTRGHVVYVLEGELVTEHKDGTEQSHGEGTTFVVGENSEPPRYRSDVGAKLFIVD
jgi:hypothetical protein